MVMLVLLGLLAVLMLLDGEQLFLLLALMGVFVTGCGRPATPPPMAPNRAALLVAAVRSDSVAVVRQLVDAGIAPDTLAPDGTRPLTEAARHGRIVVARLLLDADARLDLADSAGSRPLDYAIEAGHRDMAALLTRAAARDAGANPATLAWFDALGVAGSAESDWHRLLDGELASLALNCAILARRDDVAASLRHAAGIPNRTGYAALALAARFDDQAVVGALLEAGANPEAEVSGLRHETPLMEAARDGYVEIGVRLLHAGARVDHPDARRQTALIWAVREGETEYARMLLAAGANPALRDADGETALDVAKRINHLDLITLLQNRVPRSGR